MLTAEEIKDLKIRRRKLKDELREKGYNDYNITDVIYLIDIAVSEYYFRTKIIDYER
jgi:hypothetical protein